MACFCTLSLFAFETYASLKYLYQSQLHSKDISCSETKQFILFVQKTDLMVKEMKDLVGLQIDSLTRTSIDTVAWLRQKGVRKGDAEKFINK